MSEIGEPYISVQSVRKLYGETVAIRDLQLSFRSGEVAILLGSNGAGKSTLLRICAGLSKPDDGAVAYGAAESASDVGFFSHELMLYKHLTVREQMKLLAAVAGTSINLCEQFERWAITPFIDRRIEDLSQGQKARVSLCRTFFNEPLYVLLDEPTAALDEASVSVLVEEIRCRREAGAVTLIATHDLTRVGSLADRIVVLHRGAVSYDSGSELSENEKSQDLAKAVQLYRELNR